MRLCDDGVLSLVMLVEAVLLLKAFLENSCYKFQFQDLIIQRKNILGHNLIIFN